MKALSLIQPWLHTIVHLNKRIENRTAWRGCSYRGPIYLHASKSVGTRLAFHAAAEMILSTAEFDAVARAPAFVLSGRGGLWTPAPTLQLGGIVARARLDGVITNERDFAAYAAGVADGEAQRAWWFGGFALVLTDVEPVPFIACPGMLGLWEVPAHVESALARAA